MHLIEQNKKLTHFCDNEVAVVSEENSPFHLADMRNIDKGKRMSTFNRNTQSEPSVTLLAKQGGVITSAYSNNLIELLASMYCHRSFHFYLVMEQVEPLPYLQQLIELSRITLISHQAALAKSSSTSSATSIFISIPEFHPKTLTSDHRVNIYGVQCVFSTYPWLLSGKQKIPLYFLNTEKSLALVNQPKEMYKCLALSYQNPTTSIYSWSRLQSHKVEQLEQHFISQVNQLEALLRYVRPQIKDIDLQPTLEAIKLKKIQSLQRNSV